MKNSSITANTCLRAGLSPSYYHNLCLDQSIKCVCVGYSLGLELTINRRKIRSSAKEITKITEQPTQIVHVGRKPGAVLPEAYTYSNQCTLRYVHPPSGAVS